MCMRGGDEGGDGDGDGVGGVGDDVSGLAQGSSGEVDKVARTRL